MLMRSAWVVGIALLGSTVGSVVASAGGPPPAPALRVTYDFSAGTQGWSPIFTDLPVRDDVPGGFYELMWGWATLPSELPARGKGFMLSGNNHSDDLGMYIYRKLTPADGIVPGRNYRARITATFASNAPTGCFGSGGAPGEAVAFQLGATPLPPTRSVDVEGWYRLDNREDRFAAGDIANGEPCPADGVGRYRFLTRAQELDVRASDQGELWLLVGTESGFESTTRLYYRAVSVVLRPR